MMLLLGNVLGLGWSLWLNPGSQFLSLTSYKLYGTGEGPSVWAQRSQIVSSHSWQWFLRLPQLLHPFLSFGQRFPLGPEAPGLAAPKAFCSTASLCPAASLTTPGKAFHSEQEQQGFVSALDGWEQLCLWPEPCYLSNLKAALKFVLPFFVSWRYVELKIKWFKSGSRLNNLGQGMFSDALQETQAVVNLISSCNSTKFSWSSISAAEGNLKLNSKHPNF